MTDATTSDASPPESVVEGNAALPVPGRVEVQFSSGISAREYVASLVGLFYGVAETHVAVDQTGHSRDDMDCNEMQHRARAGAVRTAEFGLTLLGHPSKVAISSETTDPHGVVLRVPIQSRPATTTLLWLQAGSDGRANSRVLAIPVTASAFVPDAAHALIALATETGAFCGARLYSSEESVPDGTWSPERRGEDALPVVGSPDGTVWKAVAAVGGMSSPAAWYLRTQPAQSGDTPSIPPEWWTRFDQLLPRAATSARELESHLREVTLGGLAWRLAGLNAAAQADYMTPVENGVLSVLVPTSSEVVLAVDLHLSAEVVAPVLLHAIAHLALGHVRPGDKWAHWDTLQTATVPEPHRQWDRDARDYVALRLSRPTSRRIDSVEDCTAKEKAELGLYRMIGEMLGESRRLHPAAERYQAAAYQRQAASRIVAMLEDYGGAMLCDGVGLGKTYVATTLMVHYANKWREQWATSPERLLEDPFRITVLAPNSVVSTWRREALPSLAPFGVPLATVRVISHTKLSRITRQSALLEAASDAASDLEHLLLSDLVIVDEAHNFRSLAARRTKVLRDLLRVQPRREVRRRVALLTATPVNNSLEDLRQELSLLFSRPLSLSDAKTDQGYRRQALKDLRDRCAKAVSVRSKGDVAALVIHGDLEEKFADAIEFRDDLDFGPNVQRIGDYLKEQDKRLRDLQERVRAEAHGVVEAEASSAPVRIAEELMDRVVVQRSRALCKEIERQQSSKVPLLFRPDPGAPEKLHYADEYDGIQDVLARFLPLFDRDEDDRRRSRVSRLSLKVYMWYDVQMGVKTAAEVSSVVGLQRVLVLKRLESSPVSFLITLLRLTVLHAHRLQQLGNLCLDTGDRDRHEALQAQIEAVVHAQKKNDVAKIHSLATGESTLDAHRGLVASLSEAHASSRAAADTDDPSPQLSLFEGDADDEAIHDLRQQLDRLWNLREDLVRDFETLLSVTPVLADIVFGKFARAEWPRRFIAGGEAIDWPESAAWGLRLITDPKIRQLVGRLLIAMRNRQKTIVFSQFSDTVAYLRSVLSASEAFQRAEWQLVVRSLGVDGLRQEEVAELREVTVAITGDTDDRDDVVNAFAPFYRIGPWHPATEGVTENERRTLTESWETSWTGALVRPVDVLLSTDVLAEGVNLQDAALLVNFDVHWNPVRMIQRSGRIDRRLNPRIEEFRDFPDLAGIAARVDRSMPRYFWHDHPAEAPLTVNMILPEELEAELLLRERIATKTLAIDFTLGLERGTGAEADWMASYKYRGIASLNSLQRDRAIEQVASHYERLSLIFASKGIHGTWAENLNGWFRGGKGTDASPLVGRALLGRRSGDLERFSRYLEPAVVDGVPYWFWAEKRPGESMFDGWLVLDGKPEHFPPSPRRDIPWHEQVSEPLKASHLLGACEFLAAESEIVVLPSRDIGRPLMQGCTALAAPKFGSDDDRAQIAIRDFFVLQLPTFDADALAARVSNARREDNGASDVN